MRAWKMNRGGGIASLACVQRSDPALRPGEVRVAVRAVSLNHRDLLMANDGDGSLLVPASDAAGVIVETGAGVTAWRIGDRVFAAFFPDWIDGEPSDANSARGFGGGLDGLLAERVVLPASALVRVPATLEFAAAATLPCAGVTAWNALFEAGRARPGDRVLVLGSGGVSTFALQLARAAGLGVIATSSDDAKLARLQGLGAGATINYRNEPAWDRRVLELTDGRGVDLVLETGGDATLSRSIRAARKGGRIAVIGGTSGGYGGVLEPWALVGGAKTLVGELVGSRTMAESLARFVDENQVAPVIDRRFAFEDARAAFEHLAGARHLGKVVIELPGA